MLLKSMTWKLRRPALNLNESGLRQMRGRTMTPKERVRMMLKSNFGSSYDHRARLLVQVFSHVSPHFVRLSVRQLSLFA